MLFPTSEPPCVISSVASFTSQLPSANSYSLFEGQQKNHFPKPSEEVKSPYHGFSFYATYITLFLLLYIFLKTNKLFLDLFIYF